MTEFLRTRARLLGTFLFALHFLPAAQAQDAASLKARHETLRAALASNVFQRPLHLESTENDGDLKGEVYAQVAQPFAVAGPALRTFASWCDILILQPNVKGCQAGTSGDTLVLEVGRKFDQPLSDAYRFEFRYSVERADENYLRVVLSAAEGPLGTHRYRIALEATALDAGHSFLHLSYAYTSGLAARLAAHTYLATLGRAKVGFSVVGKGADGQPVYIGGTRGVVERNAMRWYLAIDAWLGALAVPEAARLEKRLGDWYDSAEHYPAQLHELERDEYLAMKRREVLRQQPGPAANTR